jgi:uncharacterized membrane protein YfcA
MTVGSAAELVGLALALAAAGAATGFLSGLFGIGGGAVAVPVLYEMFRWLDVSDEVRMQLALGTSLAVMIPTTWQSARHHASKGSLDRVALKRLAGPIVAGTAIGGLVAGSAPADVFRAVWVLFAAAMCAKLVAGTGRWRLGETLPASYGVELYGVFVGLFSTLLSIGGGVFITTLLTLYGKPVREAVGTGAGVGPLIAVPGTIAFVWAGWGTVGLPPYTLGFVNLLGVALVVPASVLAAPLGVHLAHRVKQRTLELMLAAFLASVGLRFLYALVT